MYTFDQYFCLEITNTLTQQNSRLICSSTSFAHVVQLHPINAQNIQT